MAKFLNKKEQVIDFKLTSYGNYLLSQGRFKPEMYAFYDDNVIYDASYVGLTEKQNEIHERIKSNTSYIESLVLFEDVEDQNIPYTSTTGEAFAVDMDATAVNPRKDTFRYDSMIGDARLEADTQSAPAWKIVTLDGEISSSQQKDTTNDIMVPQVNMTMTYRKKIKNSSQLSSDQSEGNIFIDDKYIKIEPDDLMIYAEESNTILLNENFDIEVFEIDNSSGKQKLERKRFAKNNKRIDGGFITQEYLDNYNNLDTDFTTDDVEYYFEIRKDQSADHKVACKGAEIFNKQSYYIDLDFDCYNEQTPENYYFDIYGPVTEPEICL